MNINNFNIIKNKLNKKIKSKKDTLKLKTNKKKSLLKLKFRKNIEEYKAKKYCNELSKHTDLKIYIFFRFYI